MNHSTQCVLNCTWQTFPSARVDREVPIAMAAAWLRAEEVGSGSEEELEVEEEDRDIPPSPAPDLAIMANLSATSAVCSAIFSCCSAQNIDLINRSVHTQIYIQMYVHHTHAQIHTNTQSSTYLDRGESCWSKDLATENFPSSHQV